MNNIEPMCLFIGGDKDGEIEYVQPTNTYTTGGINCSGSFYRQSLFQTGENNLVRLFIEEELSNHQAFMMLIKHYSQKNRG